MELYKNLSTKKSEVSAFEIGNDFVKVKFRNDRKIYVYSYRKIDRHKIDQMKLLAVSGRGLGTFINQNRDVHDGFELEP